MKYLFLILAFVAVIFADDDKIKANAQVEAEVKGKNSFKYHEANKGLAQAMELYAKSKAQKEEAAKIEQVAKPEFSSLADAMAKAKSQQEMEKYKAQQVAIKQQLEVAAKLKEEANANYSYAQKREAYCHHLKGEYYYDNEKNEEAMKEFKVSQKTSVHKKLHQTYYFMGKIHETKKENEEARACYQKAVEIKPDFSLATKALTNIESILGIKVKIGVDIFGN